MLRPMLVPMVMTCAETLGTFAFQCLHWRRSISHNVADGGCHIVLDSCFLQESTVEYSPMDRMYCGMLETRDCAYYGRPCPESRTY